MLLLQQQLAHVRGGDGLVRDGIFDGGEKPMFLEVQIVLRERHERRVAAPRHVDVLVHAARSKECFVELLDVVCGEDDDPLAPTTRPQAVGEVQQSGECHSLTALQFLKSIMSYQQVSRMLQLIAWKIASKLKNFQV